MILKGKFKALLKKETGTSKTGKQWEKHIRHRSRFQFRNLYSNIWRKH